MTDDDPAPAASVGIALEIQKLDDDDVTRVDGERRPRAKKAFKNVTHNLTPRATPSSSDALDLDQIRRDAEEIPPIGYLVMALPANKEGARAIAHTANAVPALLAEVARLRATLDQERVTVNAFVCAVGEMTNADALQRVKELVRADDALSRVAAGATSPSTGSTAQSATGEK